MTMNPLLPHQKYYPLQELIKERKSDGGDFTLTILFIDEHLKKYGKTGIPNSAYRYSSIFWSNDLRSPTHVWKPAWLTNGCYVTSIDNVSEEKRTGSIKFSFKR
ncbi:hypothetical protein SAMN05660293_01540 [Dyadobacter psychrophilus]|uniref:Uncharacterized protein n=1 Tax=Dyadobacter psychrophilus TaxID=651661 RepID=A0A1T5DDI7_9BACT|nr:hypothetical protein SAMN05660293_01540 [Dyadobacter psychrophilus]